MRPLRFYYRFNYRSGILNGSADRANARTCSAFEAFLGVDLKFIPRFGNATDGALRRASSASDALICNLVCHLINLLSDLRNNCIIHLPKNKYFR